MAPSVKQTTEDLVYKAKLAEKAERYDDMVMFMEKVATACSGNLTVDQRNFFSSSFKNVIGTRRAAWRIVSSIGKKDESEGNEQHAEIARDYLTAIEIELTGICERILKLLDYKLIPSAEDADSKVSYLKLKGDYYRYMAEYMVGPERKDAAENTLKAYKAGQDIATKELKAANHIRLGLALNFSVFYYEILNSSDKACALAKEAFEAAVSELETAEGEDSFKDSTLIIQLLRDNLKLWTGEEDDDEIMEPSE